MASLVLVGTVLASGAATSLTLKVSPDGSSFDIALGGARWLAGAEVRVFDKSSADGTLVPSARTTSQGKDALGEHVATTVEWADATTHHVLMHAVFREYPHDDGLLTFEQVSPASPPRRLAPSLLAP